MNKVNKLTKRMGILPVDIHALRIASRFFLRPNLVMIPITARSRFFLLVPLFTDNWFAINPLSLALSSSSSSASSFFCFSLANQKLYINVWGNSFEKRKLLLPLSSCQHTCILLSLMCHRLILQSSPGNRKLTV